MLKSVFTFYVFMLFLVRRSLSQDFHIAFFRNRFYKICYNPISFQDSGTDCQNGKMSLTTFNDTSLIERLLIPTGPLRQEAKFNWALYFSLIRVKNNSLNAVDQINQNIQKLTQNNSCKSGFEVTINNSTKIIDSFIQTVRSRTYKNYFNCRVCQPCRHCSLCNPCCKLASDKCDSIFKNITDDLNKYIDEAKKSINSQKDIYLKENPNNCSSNFENNVSKIYVDGIKRIEYFAINETKRLTFLRRGKTYKPW